MLRVQVPRDGRMRRVLVAFGLFALVEFATWIAILLVAYDRGGAATVGIASVAMLVPAIILVPLLSGFGDRMPRGRALSLSHAGVGVRCHPHGRAAAGRCTVAGRCCSVAPFSQFLASVASSADGHHWRPRSRRRAWRPTGVWAEPSGAWWCGRMRIIWCYS